MKWLDRHPEENITGKRNVEKSISPSDVYNGETPEKFQLNALMQSGYNHSMQHNPHFSMYDQTHGPQQQMYNHLPMLMGQMQNSSHSILGSSAATNVMNMYLEGLAHGGQQDEQGHGGGINQNNQQEPYWPPQGHPWMYPTQYTVPYNYGYGNTHGYFDQQSHYDSNYQKDVNFFTPQQSYMFEGHNNETNEEKKIVSEFV